MRAQRPFSEWVSTAPLIGRDTELHRAFQWEHQSVLVFRVMGFSLVADPFPSLDDDAEWRSWSPRLSFQRDWWLCFGGLLKKWPKRCYPLQKQNKTRDLIDLFLECENWEPWGYQQEQDMVLCWRSHYPVQGRRWATVKHTTHKHIKTSARQHSPAGNQGHHKGQHQRELPWQIMTPPYASQNFLDPTSYLQH